MWKTEVWDSGLLLKHGRGKKSSNFFHEQLENLKTKTAEAILLGGVVFSVDGPAPAWVCG